MMKKIIIPMALATLCAFGCNNADEKADKGKSPGLVAANDAAKTVNPSKDKEASKANEPESGPDKETVAFGTNIVVAEGVGNTADQALKDAFRNAVRQVVGAVVDAETIVKNDEIISDKVLTYSDGFVKSYEEIASRKDMGLLRTKIKAAVERRSVIAKLKAANVTVKDVDGKGIFAEVVTQLDADRNAAALVQKALEGYPANVIRAEVVGKPRIKDKSDTEVRLEYDLGLSIDPKKFETFAQKLIAVLDKVATEKGEINAKADEDWARSVYAKDDFFQKERKEDFLGTVFGYENRGSWPAVRFSDVNAIANNSPPRVGFDTEIWWRGGKDRRTHIAVVVTSGHSGLDDRTKWKWYCIPRDWVKLSNGSVIHISFMDEGTKELSFDQVAFKRGGGGLGRFGPALTIEDSSASFHAILSPYFFLHDAFYWRQTILSQTTKLALEEAKQLNSIRCTASLHE